MRTLPLLLLLSFGCRNKDQSTDTGVVAEVDQDGDGFTEGEDCDDNDAAVNQPGLFFQDADGDGFGDAASTTEACEAPSGYVADDSDCDDNSADSYPGADERCDELDNDCDGTVDEEVLSSWYADADADGYGDAEALFEGCDAPSGYVGDDTDCDDGQPTVFPGGVEVCDGLDNNCDGTADEGVTTTFYLDSDGDGAGDMDQPIEACELPEGYAANGDDCLDSDGAISPTAEETCDSVDNNCDGVIDEDSAVDAATWYSDSDVDGYGDPGSSLNACSQPGGYVADDTDCDDADASLNPGTPELCDGIDNDCDGAVDMDDGDVIDAETWYQDSDADGYGDPAAPQDACDAPSGYVSNSGDCDDSEPLAWTGNTESCDDVDNNCDGSVDEGLDQDWYADSDGDGYGDPDTTLAQCDTPSGYVSDDSDCDDSDASVNPAATEIWYDGVDQDCDAAADYDQDGDGYDSSDYGGTDCDDSDATRYEGVGCRPTASCTHPDITVLDANDPRGASDLVWTDSCEALMPTTISGTDYVCGIDSSGSTGCLTGYGNYNMRSVAVDPSSGAAVVGYASTQALGWESSGSLPLLASGSGSYPGYNAGPWSNAFQDNIPTSIAVDSSGCVWFPNWKGMGNLYCIDASTGSETLVASPGTRIESVALDSADQVYITVTDTLYSVDTSTGALTGVYTASDTILDVVFDYDDSLYIETTDDYVTWVAADFGSDAVFAAISGDANLSISPDGWLVRMMGDPVGYASYEEFELGD